MENHRTLSKVLRIAFAVMVCLVTLAPNAAPAQQSAPGVRDPFADVRERQQREAHLRSGEMVGTAKKVDTREFEEAAKQTREDFKGIQIMRNNVVRHLKSGKPLDYRFIASETELIHSRANRLKAHLARESAPGEKKEEVKQVELGDNQIMEALVTMCKRIDSFTENPTFKVLDVVDAEQSSKARRDLRDIIRLSGGIVKLTEKLNKAAGK